MGELVQAPEIYFCENCPTAIKQFNEYVWDEYTGRAADHKQDRGKPRDKNDHQVENAHRLLKEDYKFKEEKPIKTEDFFVKHRKATKTKIARRINY